MDGNTGSIGGIQNKGPLEEVRGTEAADEVRAGPDDNLILSAGGADKVWAGRGDDTVVHVLAENSGARDWYNGGSGDDTLRLEFTADEWSDPAVQADILAFEQHLASGGGAFRFRAFDLRVNRFEALEVIVDGAKIDTAPSALQTPGRLDAVSPTDQADDLRAGAEKNLITDRGGADKIRAQGGDDTVVYVASDNEGVRDWYHGGTGQDTLRLELTGAEWSETGVQADVQAFLAHLEDGNGAFRFRAFDLRVNKFEALEVYVDGVAIDPSAKPAEMQAASPALTALGSGPILDTSQTSVTNNGSAALVVTTASDTVADDGETSLREAIMHANAQAGTDTITFDGSVFIGGADSVIRLSLGALEITDAVTINGATGTDVIISGDAFGNDVTGDSAFITDLDDEAPRFGSTLEAEAFLGDNSRIFNITDATANTRLEGLTLTGGRVEGGTAQGGAIRTVADLIIVDGVLSGNSISNDGAAPVALAGGAIFTTGSSLQIVGTVLSGNEAQEVPLGFPANFRADGGAIYASGSTNIFLTTTAISDNSAAADGGGIGTGNSGPGANLTASRSTISDNDARGSGGGFDVSGNINFSNVTVASNTLNGGDTVITGLTGSLGGGGRVSGDATITDSTFTGNLATAQTFIADGGGLDVFGDLTLTNSLILGNNSNGSEPEVRLLGSSTSTFNGLNIVGRDTAAFDATVSANVENAPATAVFADTVGNNGVQAGALADNGGPVQTVALLPDLDNPAIDRAAAVSLNDARLLPRAVDVPGAGNEGADFADVGAFEAQINNPTGLVVTTTADGINPLDGETSLREAIAFADADGVDSTITFATSILDADGKATIVLTEGQLELISNITIDGDIDNDGRPDITIDANGQSRVLDISSQIASLDGLVITNGRPNGANGLDGGGLRSVASLLTLTNSIVTDNEATGKGAGLYLAGGGNTQITGATISGNETGGGDGGGIFTSQSLLTISDSTLNDNSAVGNGGGVLIGGSATITNTTIADNNATGGGGAIYDGAAVSLINSTIVGNSSAIGYGGLSLGTFVLTDSIVLDNGIDISGPYGVTGNNVIGRVGDSGQPIVDNGYSAADIFATDGSGAVIGLADNGGPVQTIALRNSTSNVALDASAGSSIPAADARGVAAEDIAGVGASSGAGLRDLGAFEAQNPEVGSLLVTTNQDVVDDLDGLTSLREALTLANNQGGTDTIEFDSTVFTGGADSVIRLVQGALQIVDGVNIDGSGATDLVITGDVAGNDTTDPDSLVTTNIQGNDNVRVLNILTGLDTALSNLTITGGATNASGAAIQSAAALSLTNLRATGNEAGALGSAISSTADITAVASTIDGNLAERATIHTTGNVSLTNVTLFDNLALQNDAAISADGNVTLTHSTLTRNIDVTEADDRMINAGGDVTVTNSILLGNASRTAANGEAGITAGGSLTFAGVNIVGEGTDTDASDGVINGAIRDVFADINRGQVFLVIDSDGNADPFEIVTGDLADNGGPVPTVALSEFALNPAVDAATSALTEDARGETRPFDQVRVADGAGTSDIGAFEDTMARDPLGTLVVNTTADDIADGLTSLREAVAFANINSGADTITFDATVFTGGANSVIRLTQGQIEITEALTIDASAGTDIVVTGDANGDDTLIAGTFRTDVTASATTRADNDRIFDIGAGAPVTIQALELTGGYTPLASENFSDGIGGAIRSVSNLTLIDSHVIGNFAGRETPTGFFYAASGGGIGVDGDLTVRNSTISGNEAIFFGGGLSASGLLTLEDSEITRNTSRGLGGGALADTVRITGSTISENLSFSEGGGLHAGTGFIEESTIDGNLSLTRGGGVFSDGSLTLFGVTLSDNSAGTSGGGAHVQNAIVTNTTFAGNETLDAGGLGGGLRVTNDAQVLQSTFTGNAAANGGGIAGASATVINSLVLGNSSTSAVDTSEVDLTTLTLDGANIIGTSTAAFDASSDPDASNAAVAEVFDTVDAFTGGGGLADNGGPVETVALLAALSNPALDAGDAAELSETAQGVDVDDSGAAIDTIQTDARGFARTIDAPDTVGAAPDLGAFETQIAPTPGPDILTGTTETDFLEAQGGNDLVRAAGTRPDSLAGGLGNDTLIGSDGSDILQGGSGADVLDGGAGVVDYASYGDLDSDLTIDLRTDFSDPANASSDAVLEDTFISIEGFIGTEDQINTFFGSDGANRYIGGTNIDNVFGFEGEDFLQGQAGNDTIDGGAASDLIFGGVGDDELTGGGGADPGTPDTFWFGDEDGNDVITDFNLAVDGDRIGFFGRDINAPGDLSFEAATNGDLVVRYNTTNTITLEGLQQSVFDASGIDILTFA